MEADGAQDRGQKQQALEKGQATAPARTNPEVHCGALSMGARPGVKPRGKGLLGHRDLTTTMREIAVAAPSRLT
jgi:hypothetical protein